MKAYIIAGEASGDLHGSNLIKSLKKKEENIQFRFWGGDLMQEEAGVPVKHIKELAFMGFVEVAMHLRTILGNIKFCKQDILEYQPDVLILIDYPGFNMRIAEFAHQNGIRVAYYISPQIWAWKQSRVHKIKKFVDEMYVILPFEKEFYARFGVAVDFVGHPLIDAIEQWNFLEKEDFVKKHHLDERPIMALLPGSRKQEIKRKLPVMYAAAKHFKTFQIVVACAPGQDLEFYKSVVSDPKVNWLENKTYALLNHSDAAFVTSGTATLETALFNVPQVVCYKGDYFSYHIAKRLVKVDYISLVNLVMNDEVVKELIQSEMNERQLVDEMNKIIPGGSKRDEMLKNYKILKEKLGGGGASDEVARLILDNKKRPTQ